MKRDRFVPGNICHAPNETAEPDVRAFCRRFADFIIDAIVVGVTLGSRMARRIGTRSTGDRETQM
jgi:hypothetical protein